MKESSDHVSRIHTRYTFTLITPSSKYQSLFASIAIATVLVAVATFGYFQDNNFVIRLAGVIAVLVATQYIDSRFTKNQEYSKSLHMSLFGNLSWVLVALAGLVSLNVFSKTDPHLFYIVEGMFIFASFRLGLFTTVLGVSLKRALLLCMIQPLAMFLLMTPPELLLPSLTNPIAIGFGAAFIVMSSIWSRLTDKAGWPGIPSTHKLIQAYLSSRGQNYYEVEKIIDERSEPRRVTTSQIQLKSNDDKQDFRLVLPEIHPGPYHPIGGSNIPYLIYKNLNSSAMVMHSISDHSLNLPSKKEVDTYLSSLSSGSVTKEGISCTEPVVVQVNKARVTGMLFDKNVVLFLSLSPHGMEDIPCHIKEEIEQYSKNRNFENPLIVDCHNAMGEEIGKEDSQDMLAAVKSCLDNLISKESFPLEFGYSNSNSMNLNKPDLGMGGIGVLCLKINNKKFFLGWADANNMENGLRESIVDQFAKSGYTLIEICTSDTHFSQSIVRTKQGYYHFGKITDAEEISNWYIEVAKNAEQSIKPAKFAIISHETTVKVMGPKIFQDFLKALENSLKLSKGFFIGGMVLFFTSLIL